MSYEFEFIPDYWQDEWNPDETAPFIVQYDFEEGDPDSGLDDDFPYVVMLRDTDITDQLNSLNQKQVEAEIQKHFEAHNTPDYDGQPDEAQEWHDFNPDC